MTERDQFFREQPFDTEREARYGSRHLAFELTDVLEKNGYGDFVPPPKPDDNLVIWDVWNQCRVLVQYVMPRAHVNPDYQDKFVCRVDTTARKLTGAVGE